MNKEWSEETKSKVYLRHSKSGFCEHPECFKKSVTIAHRFKKGKYGRNAVRQLLREKYQIHIANKNKMMDNIVHHDLNTVPCCEDLKHNSSFLVSGLQEENLIIEICKRLGIIK